MGTVARLARFLLPVLCLVFPTQASSQELIEMSWPVVGPRITQDYSCKGCYLTDRYHIGIDIANSDLEIKAAADGVVYRTYSLCGDSSPASCGDVYGNHVVIRHGSIYALYAHLESLHCDSEGDCIKHGDMINQGDPVGTMGKTGGTNAIHLHFQLMDYEPGKPGDNPNDNPSWNGDFGMEDGYKGKYPAVVENGWAFLDPKIFLPKRGMAVTAATSPIYEAANLAPPVINRLDNLAIFVGLERSAEGDFYIVLPSNSSPDIPQRAYGWVPDANTTLASLPTEDRLRVIGSQKDKLPVYEDHTTDSTVLYQVWADQDLIAYGPPFASDDPACAGEWYPIGTPIGLDGMGPEVGWVCGDYLISSTPSMPANPMPLSGGAFPVPPIELTWDRVPNAEFYTVVLDGVEGVPIFRPRFEINQSLAPTQHTWRVRAHNFRGTTEGELWSFTYSPNSCFPESGSGCDHSIDIVDGATASPSVVASQGIANLSITAHDTFGHTLHFGWGSACPGLPSNGTFDSQFSNVTFWTAPENNSGLTQQCTLVVSINDGAGGLTAIDSTVVQVAPVEHSLTIISFPSGSPNPLAPGGTASLTVLAHDTNADHGISYSWSADCPGLPNDGGWTGSGTRTPMWRAPQNNTGAEQACTITVDVEDYGSGAGLSLSESYIQRVSPGGVSSLSISDGIRFLEPPPYTSSDQPTVQSTIRNTSGTAQIIDRVQCFIDFVDSGGFTYQRDCEAENFDSTLTLSPGGEYTYTKPVSSTLGGGEIGYVGVVTIHVKFDGLPGQEPITTAEEGASAQLVFEKDHTVQIVNTPFSFVNPVESGGVTTFTANGVDSMNHEEIFTWTVSCPGLPSDGSFVDTGMPWRPDWVAPDNFSAIDQECPVQITVSDVFGLSDTFEFVQTVLQAPHTLDFTSPPSSNLDQVIGNLSVQLSSLGVDSYGHSVGYAWDASCPGLSTVGVFNDPASRSPIWTSPANTTGSTVTCNLTVMLDDGLGLTAQDSVQVEVLPTSAPSVVTEEASNASSTSLQLNATVDTAGLSTDAWFAYGAGNLDNVTSAVTLAGNPSSVPHSDVISIECGTEYLFKAVVEGPGGVAEGQVLSFTTGECPLFSDGFESGDTGQWSNSEGSTHYQPGSEGTDVWITSFFDYGDDYGVDDEKLQGTCLPIQSSRACGI